MDWEKERRRYQKKAHPSRSQVRSRGREEGQDAPAASRQSQADSDKQATKATRPNQPGQPKPQAKKKQGRRIKLWRSAKDQLGKPSQAKARPPRKKQAAKVPAKTRWTYYGIFIFLLFVAIYLASPLNHVQGIQVRGNRQIKEEDLVRVSGLHPSMSLGRVDALQETAMQRINAAYPQVQSVNIQVDDQRNVLINIQEHRVVGYVKKKDFYYPVLENQIILDKAMAEPDKELPLFEGFDDGQVLKLAEQLGQLPDRILQQIVSIHNTSTADYPNHLSLKMRDGNIVTGFMLKFVDYLQYYDQVLEILDGQKGLLDMDLGIFFTELTPANNPFASAEEKEAYEAAHPSASQADRQEIEVKDKEAPAESGSQADQSSSQSGQGSAAGTSSSASSEPSPTQADQAPAPNQAPAASQASGTPSSSQPSSQSQ
ncbi:MULTISPECIES: cell division protein FtsQ/DivIB [Aerococcus]|uniref:Cell division protein DivIB n=1 Tax=Aerococcus sanguinicola TaxID=119206 RepID=A0A5N1GJB3_9LACT|nr:MULTISPECIES: cell division protein FtsQ/DivIB [Aerococcus]KAA9300872.1 FtsQ-type POTRA domain-containing protein [Aerococcus sanguinicola]MDK6369103.1 FtsQ-type POTRA domain-containing protein [Aerococcus sp. UMB9870]MDK6679838.1 FtsQ-type POTRA domain-containing protein [Aerococcus sp. UMB8608]MDK6686596.1 FtsQ-type POTRA domain-containing protein [Aerococcus sp. UMB8623]MDK6939760.1 FtsQ-type POTRA domain-containing protein [Aerococcus sp. UMB8487]